MVVILEYSNVFSNYYAELLYNAVYDSVTNTSHKIIIIPHAIAIDTSFARPLYHRYYNYCTCAIIYTVRRRPAIS